MLSPFSYLPPDLLNTRLSLNKHIAFSEAAWIGVIDRTLSTPPITPTSGFYIFQSPASGLASGQEQKIGWFYEGEWFFFTPQDGQILKSIADDTDIVYESFSNSWKTTTLNNNLIDENNDGVVNSAEKIAGIELAPNNTFYGKNISGTVGFFSFSGFTYRSYNSNFLAAVNSVNRVNTSGNSVTVTLPANPSDRSIIAFYDGDGNNPTLPTGFGVNSLIINPNGKTIQGRDSPSEISIENAVLELIYHEDEGWRVKNSNFILFAPSKVLYQTQDSDFNAIANSVVRVLTSNNTVTATLPPNPYENATIAFYDGSGNNPTLPTGFGRNALVLEPNGKQIQGSDDAVSIAIENGNVELIYHEDGGWRIKNFTNGSSLGNTANLVRFTHTADFNAIANSTIQVLTADNPVIATLPSDPPENAIIALYDGSGSDPNVPTGLGLNPLTINPNGKTIQGKTGNYILDLENSSIELIYHTATGWRIKNLINESFFTLPAPTYLSFNRDFTATVNSYNNVSTQNNPVTATLPADPPENAFVAFFDGSGGNSETLSGFGKNPLTIDPNGRLIQSRFEPLILSTENSTVELIYNAATGWRIRNATVGGAIIALPQPTNVRQKSSNDRILVVSNDGDDSYDGINSPLRTIQSAVNRITGYDSTTEGDLVIEVRDGSYQGFVMRSISGQGKLIIRGSGNTIITSPITGKYGGKLVTENLKINTSENTGIDISNGIYQIGENTEFGTCNIHIRLFRADCIIANNYQISGNSPFHISAIASSHVASLSQETPIECSLIDNPHFASGFIHTDLNATVQLDPLKLQFNGSATGIRYRVEHGGIINVIFGREDYFPGNINGLVIRGGRYLI